MGAKPSWGRAAPPSVRDPSAPSAVTYSPLPVPVLPEPYRPRLLSRSVRTARSQALSVRRRPDALSPPRLQVCLSLWLVLGWLAAFPRTTRTDLDACSRDHPMEASVQNPGDADSLPLVEQRRIRSSVRPRHHPGTRHNDLLLPTGRQCDRQRVCPPLPVHNSAALILDQGEIKIANLPGEVL